MPRTIDPTTKAALIKTIGVISAALIAAVAAIATTRGLPSGSGQTLKFPVSLDARCPPSGWMGDGAQGRRLLTITAVPMDVLGQPKMASKFEYRAGPDGWAGVYWQCPDGNWGHQPGLNLTGARAISFLARGERGTEIVEFKAGGIRGTFSDTYETSLGKVALAREWKDYRIDVSGLNLTSAIGPFAWSAPAGEGGLLVFYLAQIEIQ